MSDPAATTSTATATTVATPGQAGAQAGNADPDPGAVLAKLQDKLGQDEAQVASLTTELAMLRSDITGLKQGLSKIDSAVEDYRRAKYPDAATALKDTAATQTACLQAALGGKLAGADQVIQGLRTDIDAAGKARDDAAAGRDSANASVAQAEASLSQAQAVWDQLAGLPAALAAQFRILTSLQNQAKQAMDTSDHFGAYAMVTEVGRLLNAAKPDLRTPEEYRVALIKAWDQLSAEQQNTRDARVALGTAEAALKQAQTRLDQLTADRVAELRRRWALPPAASAPQVPTTPQGPTTTQAPAATPAPAATQAPPAGEVR